jgi:Aminoglycoside-2''-adenylyltransferase
VTWEWDALPVRELATLFDGVDAPWWVAGGQAIDLWLGRTTRPHVDLDVQVLQRDRHAFRDALVGWELAIAHEGVLTTWRDGDLPDVANALWCRPEDATPWSFELLLSPAVGDQWVFRRDDRITLPLADIGWTTDTGIPVVVPEVQLLFKAKEGRPQDEADLANALPELDPARRAWLAEAIELAHPGHPWVATISGGTRPSR